MDDNVKNMLRERFAELPEAVQRAVTDASVEKKLRALAAKYKLHLDQWVLLENEIMLTLLGLEAPENMVKNVAKEVHVDEALAQQIVNDIALQVFQPIRKQIQGELDHEPLKRKSVPVGKGAATPEKAEREKIAPSDSSAYKPGQKSTERRDVQEDPYRESIE